VNGASTLGLRPPSGLGSLLMTPKWRFVTLTTILVLFVDVTTKAGMLAFWPRDERWPKDENSFYLMLCIHKGASALHDATFHLGRWTLSMHTGWLLWGMCSAITLLLLRKRVDRSSTTLRKLGAVLLLYPLCPLVATIGTCLAGSSFTVPPLLGLGVQLVNLCIVASWVASIVSNRAVLVCVVLHFAGGFANLTNLFFYPDGVIDFLGCRNVVLNFADVSIYAAYVVLGGWICAWTLDCVSARHATRPARRWMHATW
jgi:lipoprotein signal peptidase